MEKKSFLLWCQENNKINLIELWDNEKNEKRIEDVTYSSAKKYHFKCKKGHTWQKPIYTIIKKNGCPFCNNTKKSKEYNLAIVKPKSTKFWDYEKNCPIKPEDVYPNGTDMYWWKCPKGHSFSRKPNAIRNDTNRCPYCSHKRVTKEYNPKVKFPYIVEEWIMKKMYLVLKIIYQEAKKKFIGDVN